MSTGKACTKCNEAKPMDDFGPRKVARDGRRSRCRECVREDARAYATSDKGRAARMRYQHSEQGAAVHARFRRKHANSPLTIARKRRADAARRDSPRAMARMAAGRAVGREVTAGRMPAARGGACETPDAACSGHCEYHHDSYEKHRLLDVRRLCLHHHNAWHRANKPTYPTEVPSE